MSELTRCNYCTLQDIKRRAKKNKEEVIIEKNGGGISVFTVKDGEKRFKCWFMELSNNCCC